MDYAYLQAYLETVLPKEQVVIIIEAFNVLRENGMDGQDYQIQQEMALAENSDTSITVQSIYNLALPLVKIVLGNFGVRLKEDVLLDEAVDVLRGLTSLENYCDAETILQYCDNSEGPEDALAQILTNVGAFTIGHYEALFVDVNPMLLEKIETVMLGQLKIDPESMESINTTKERLLGFFKHHPNQPFMVLNDVKAGIKLTLPLENYLKPHLEELEMLAKGTSDKDISELVIQLLAFILASNTPSDKIREVCDNELDALYVDKAQVTKADIKLLSYMQEINYHAEA